MEASRRKVVELNIEDVLPNRFQPRIKFSEEAINELSKSIKEHGVIQPIVVRPIGDKFEIIAGERRYKASCMAGLKTIPALITDLNDKDSAEVALIENVQRENLTPIEEAISYRKILDMGYITQDALAIKLGKTQSTIANKLRLLNLDDEVQEALLKEKISERHARSLLRLTDKSQQKAMLNRIISERLPVRRTDEEIEKMLNGIVTENEDGLNENFNIIEPTEINNDINNNLTEEQNGNRDTSNFKFININNNLDTEEEPIPPEEDIRPGKFFNILSEEDKKEEKTESIEKFDFNSMFINPIITEQSQNKSLLDELAEIENSINNSNIIPPIEENSQANIESNETENINVQDIEDFELEELDFIEDDEISSNNESESIEEQNTQLEQIKSNEIEINNFKDVLQTIRNCSNKIEEAGFIIDTEEYDLDGSYQIIFKIKKTD